MESERVLEPSLLFATGAIYVGEEVTIIRSRGSGSETAAVASSGGLLNTAAKRTEDCMAAVGSCSALSEACIEAKLTANEAREQTEPTAQRRKPKGRDPMNRTEMITHVERLRARLEQETDIAPLRAYACHEYGERLHWMTRAEMQRRRSRGSKPSLA